MAPQKTCVGEIMTVLEKIALTLLYKCCKWSCADFVVEGLLGWRNFYNKAAMSDNLKVTLSVKYYNEDETVVNVENVEMLPETDSRMIR